MNTKTRFFSLIGLGLAALSPMTHAAVAANGKIAYVVGEYSSAAFAVTYDIWVMDPDGSNPVNLTHTPDISEMSPSWSGDGQKIAYTLDIGASNSNIWVMNADGSNPQQVTFKDQPDTYAWQGDPSFSPDGSKIAFSRHRPFSYMGDQTDVFVINVDGTGETPITNLTPDSIPFDEGEPAWSPDGTKIAMAAVRFESFIDLLGVPQQGAQREIITVNPDGSGEQILSAGDPLSERGQYLEDDHSPAWSPDGSRLLFASQSQVPACCNPWQTWIVNADGTGLADISPDPTVDDTGAVWSPDGTQILVTRTNGTGGTDLYLMPAPTAPATPAALTARTLAASRLAVAPATAAPIQLTTLGTVTDAAWAPQAGSLPTKLSLSVAKAGNGRGYVLSSPAGISCGKICSAEFDQGSVVILTARPHDGDKFQRWDGACTKVRKPVCAVTMDTMKTVTAVFRHQ